MGATETSQGGRQSGQQDGGHSGMWWRPVVLPPRGGGRSIPARWMLSNPVHACGPRVKPLFGLLKVISVSEIKV